MDPDPQHCMYVCLIRRDDDVCGDEECVVLHGRHDDVRHVPDAVVEGPPGRVTHPVQVASAVVCVDISYMQKELQIIYV